MFVPRLTANLRWLVVACASLRLIRACSNFIATCEDLRVVWTQNTSRWKSFVSKLYIHGDLGWSRYCFESKQYTHTHCCHTLLPRGCTDNISLRKSYNFWPCKSLWISLSTRLSLSKLNQTTGLKTWRLKSKKSKGIPPDQQWIIFADK